jgi:hypothetical protein
MNQTATGRKKLLVIKFSGNTMRTSCEHHVNRVENCVWTCVHNTIVTSDYVGLRFMNPIWKDNHRLTKFDVISS